MNNNRPLFSLVGLVLVMCGWGGAISEGGRQMRVSIWSSRDVLVYAGKGKLTAMDREHCSRTSRHAPPRLAVTCPPSVHPISLRELQSCKFDGLGVDVTERTRQAALTTRPLGFFSASVSYNYHHILYKQAPADDPS